MQKYDLLMKIRNLRCRITRLKEQCSNVVIDVNGQSFANVPPGTYIPATIVDENGDEVSIQSINGTIITIAGTTECPEVCVSLTIDDEIVFQDCYESGEDIVLPIDAFVPVCSPATYVIKIGETEVDSGSIPCGTEEEIDITPYIPACPNPPCAPATIVNSDGEFSINVPSGSTYELPDTPVLVTDLGGNPLGSGDVPSVTGGTIEVDIQPFCAPATYTITRDNLPFDSGTIPSGGELEVNVPSVPCDTATFTLINTDETVLNSGTIPSGGSETITAPDSDISLNGVAFPSIPSGGSDNIQVRRATGSSLVGSKQGQHWRIANTTVQLKDTANNNIGNVNSYAAETANELTAPDATANVTIDGSPFQTVNIPSGGSATIDVPSWTRPSDWLPMPTVLPTEQTFVGLYAIFPSANNFAAFRFDTSTGDYQVDWGDGTVTTHASNDIAEHTYDYATYDTVNTTLSTRGYKQAMIVVMPLTGNLTDCNFQFRRTTTPAQNQAYATGFLDCILSMPNAIGGVNLTFGGLTVTHRYVERFDIKTIGDCNLLISLFSNCTSLQSVPLFNTENVIIMNSMFSNCASLQSVPLFNTASVQSFNNTFAQCSALKSVPLFNTENVTNINGLFRNCTSLQSVPLFNTENVTEMGNTFVNAASLQSIPLLNTASVQNFNQTFRACVSLNTIPNLNTSGATNMSDMFTLSSSFDRTDIICRVSVSFINCQLSRDEIVNIFNNLLDRTSLASANINVSGNWGASVLTAGDIAIATAKNWTVTT